MPKTPGVHLALFAGDTCLYATERKEGYVLRKLQCGLNSWRPGVGAGIQKSVTIYFSHQIRQHDYLLMLNEWNIPFVNSVKYPGVIFNKKVHGDYTQKRSKPRPSEHPLEYIPYSKVSD
jgi:hypothetical protein